MKNKVVRTICYFVDKDYSDAYSRLNDLAEILVKNNYIIQTKRICANDLDIRKTQSEFNDDKGLLLGAGTIQRDYATAHLQRFLDAENVLFNLDLTHGVEMEDAEFLFKIIEYKPQKTFHFAYKFLNSNSTPYFPVATFSVPGFSIGLQSTCLAENCNSVDEWLMNMKTVWDELCTIFKDESDFLGIDSSVSPLYEGKSSLVSFVKKMYRSFTDSVTTDVYLRITGFIKEKNPKPIGLCGIMFPCLEDFELAAEYESGNFSIERNIFLSLHSGLGIDTYPIGIDESPERVYEILKVLQAFSLKYNKPLSARFVSDGKAKTGEKTDFQNQYMKDVVVRKL